jgi:hypothetical protein
MKVRQADQDDRQERDGGPKEHDGCDHEYGDE